MQIEQMRLTTDAIFDGPIRLPTSRAWEEKLLTYPNSYTEFNYRCWQAEKLGFRRVYAEVFVEEYMGSPPTVKQVTEDKAPPSWVYSHTRHREEHEEWQASVTDWGREERAFWPPFRRREVWRCQMCDLANLGKLPEDMTWKVMEVKGLNLFNCFQAIRSVRPRRRPVILASLWEMPRNRSRPRVHGASANFFFGI